MPPPQFIFLDCIILIVFSGESKLFRSSLRNFLRRPATSNILLCTLFSNNINLCLSLSVKDELRINETTANKRPTNKAEIYIKTQYQWTLISYVNIKRAAKSYCIIYGTDICSILTEWTEDQSLARITKLEASRFLRMVFLSPSAPFGVCKPAQSNELVKTEHQQYSWALQLNMNAERKSASAWGRCEDWSMAFLSVASVYQMLPTAIKYSSLQDHVPW